MISFVVGLLIAFFAIIKGPTIDPGEGCKSKHGNESKTQVSSNGQRLLYRKQDRLCFTKKALSMPSHQQFHNFKS